MCNLNYWVEIFVCYTMNMMEDENNSWNTNTGKRKIFKLYVNEYTLVWVYIEVAQYHLIKIVLITCYKLRFFFVCSMWKYKTNVVVHGNHSWHLVHKKLFWLQIISLCKFKTKGIDLTVLVNRMYWVWVNCNQTMEIPVWKCHMKRSMWKWMVVMYYRRHAYHQRTSPTTC